MRGLCNTYRTVLGVIIDVAEFEPVVHDFFATPCRAIRFDLYSPP